MQELLGTRRYKVGYEIRTERFSGADALGGAPFILKSAFTIPEGYYIGDSKMAHRLIVQRGIKPEPRKPNDPEANDGWGYICTIGFSEREQAWFGWSHRAICGFEIGDKIFDPNYGHDLLETKRHGEEVIKNLDQAKQAAINFAESVS